MNLQDRATLWYDTARVLALEAVKVDNTNRVGESNNLACVLGATLSELECAEDDQEREEIEFELAQAVEAVKVRVLELIADTESGGKHSIISNLKNEKSNNMRH